MAIPLLLTAAMAWLVIHLVVSSTVPRAALDRRERGELDALRVLVDDLKETAWEHRELDSPLSTIVIDKIRTHERRRRELD
ncbi:MAG TPA: hypothetical protein VER39_12415 [Nocardioidaceae bacterium]|nr:hypothetical protein [Nocardioidaceae bacterium]